MLKPILLLSILASLGDLTMFLASMSIIDVRRLVNKYFFSIILSPNGKVPLKEYPGVSLQYYGGKNGEKVLVHPVIE